MQISLVGPLALTAMLIAEASSPTLQAAPTLDVQCIGCHPAQASTWAGSQHQTSFTESTFQTALRIDPLPFCTGCHAPQSDRHTVTITEPTTHGVGCINCHGQGASIRTGMWTSHRPAPHPVIHDPAFGGPATCGSCHQFGFPDNAVRDTPLSMQSTVDEHADSRFADHRCSSCHSSRAFGVTDHRFTSSRDPESVRKALTIVAQRESETSLRIDLQAHDVGHAVPTGDLFRRLEVEVFALGTSRPSQRQYLDRRFRSALQANGIRVQVESADRRVPASGTPRHVYFEIPSVPVLWWVSYQRVAHNLSSNPAFAELDGEFLLASGLAL